MNAAHLHILFNHFPIIGFLIGLCVLLAGVFMGQSILRQTGLLILFLAALAGIPTYYSGHEAEELVERFAAKTAVDEHAAAAEWAYYLTLTTGAAAAAAFIAGWKDWKWNRYATIGVVVLGSLSSAALLRTGLLGGKIRHTEFSDETPQPPAEYSEPMIPHTHNHQH